MNWIINRIAYVTRAPTRDKREEKTFYSMYVEPASYEDYAPVGWKTKYASFLDLIPAEKRYWEQ